MSHDILSNLFYSTRSKPAWHGINFLNDNPDIEDKPRTATEIYELMAIPKYEMLPLAFQFDGKSFTSDSSVVVRHPRADETLPAVMGTVSNDYHPVYPKEAVAIWDKNVNISVETFGILANGAKLFISGLMPAFDVKKDAVQPYILLYSPTNGVEAATGLVAATRVVCQNTLHMALSEGKQRFRVVHSAGAGKRLGKWLKDTYQAALMTVEVMKESYNILANTKVSLPEITWISEQVYKLPKKPLASDAFKTPLKLRLAEWEYKCEWADRARSTILELYNGRGVGLQSPSIAGTAWAGFNAFTEFETYRRGTTESMAHGVLVGERARKIRMSHRLFMDLAK